jgi:hypothetical protein
VVVAVVPVGEPGPGPAPEFPVALVDRAAAWYERVSRGRSVLEFRPFATVRAPRPLSSYSSSGGKGSWPTNSQGLVADVLASVVPLTAAALARADGGLLIVTPDRFQPHAWHMPNGGVAVGDGGWIRDYAVVPVGGTLGALVHEIGHLAFRWPDVGWPLESETECLMARGATGARAEDPALPCAALLVRQGWRDPVRVGRRLTVDDLAADGGVGAIEWQGKLLLVEARPGRLLLMTTDTAPRLLSYVRVPDAKGGRSVLGLLASSLRRLN